MSEPLPLSEPAPLSEPVSLAGPVPGPVAARGRSSLNPSLVVGGLIVALIVVMALLSFVWTPYDATLVDPAVRLVKPSWSHWFGTDKFGRDVLSQIMVGSRT